MTNRENIKLFRKADVICIVFPLLLSVLFLLLSQIAFSNTDSVILKIEVNGNTEYYSLNQDQTVELSSGEYFLTVTVSDGSAWISHSTCPDGVCKTMGKINKNGQIAVCAPARVAISIESSHLGEEDTDAITR